MAHMYVYVKAHTFGRADYFVVLFVIAVIVRSLLLLLNICKESEFPRYYIKYIYILSICILSIHICVYVAEENKLL